VAELAIRRLSRLAGELHLSGVAALARLLPGAGDEGVVALVLLRVCLADWTPADRIGTPAAITQGTTLRSLTRSLDRSPGTMHGLVQRLVARDFVERGPGRLHVSPAAAARVVAYLEEVHDLILRFAEDMRAAGAPAADGRGGRACPMRMVLAVGLDMMLIPFETFRGEVGDWTAKKLWIALSTLAVRHITTDPVLSARHAVASTPDSERRAVPATLLRSVTGLSTPTAWRRLKALEAAGLAAQRDGGWIIRSHQLLEPAVEASVRTSLDYYLRRLNELVAAGLDAGRPPYLTGRPPLVTGDAGTNHSSTIRTIVTRSSMRGITNTDQCD
jgi:DNA-binding MarR family transcriptional regulator